MDGLQDRFLNVSLLPGSEAHLAYYARMNSSLPGAARPVPARPALQLHFFGGKHDRRLRAVVTVGSGAADSRHSLGGYHGSTNVAGAAVYYAVGVYSEGGNGVPVFDQPWKNVAATFCHELNEARTDPDVKTPSGPATAPGSAGTPPRAARSATSRSGSPGPGSPSSSPRSSWPTARAPSRSS